ncbi:unnamed protein product [Amoebophrya sp. A120]|nr:unnamed protein product [Amoebophrya sp. A120]|eukprot:GSA120T00003770001.1
MDVLGALFCQEIPGNFFLDLIFGRDVDCGPHIALFNLPLPLFVPLVVAVGSIYITMTVLLSPDESSYDAVNNALNAAVEEPARDFQTSRDTAFPAGTDRNFVTTVAPDATYGMKTAGVFEATGAGARDAATLEGRRNLGLGEKTSGRGVVPGVGLGMNLKNVHRPIGFDPTRSVGVAA